MVCGPGSVHVLCAGINCGNAQSIWESVEHKLATLVAEFWLVFAAMVKKKLTIDQQKKALTERAEALDVREDRQITAARLKDTEVLRSVKAFLQRKGDWPGSVDAKIKLTTTSPIGRTGSHTSHSPSLESVDGKAEVSPVAEVASTTPAEANEVKFQQGTVHRNFGCWLQVPPGTIRQLLTRVAPVSLSWPNLRA
eukprot:3304951-Amphidinium_carterae.1